MIIKLIPADGGKPLQLLQTITVIGRNPDYCDIVISHDKISAVHCVISQASGMLFVRDMNSTNGTFVNNVHVLRSVVFPGDRINLAEFSFIAQVDRNEEFLSRDEPREVVTFIPRPTTGQPGPFESPAPSNPVKPSQPSPNAPIQVYDSFIGKVME